MPYADNLYSADDSDAESFSNELSPTDGYFSNRDHPQDVMVPDPSLEMDHNTADSKAREAREEAIANPDSYAASGPELPASPPLRVAPLTSSINYSSSSPTAYNSRSPTSSHRHQDDLYSETSPLINSTAPPPAYSAATSQPSLQHFNANYSTISARQLESGIREPESMGGPHDFDERSPLWMKQVKRLPPWRLLRNILLVILVLGLAAGFIVAAVKSGESKKNKGDSPPGKSPSKGPEDGHGSYCPSGSIHNPDALPIYEFELGRDLVILQVTGGENFRGGAARVRTAGEIIVRRQIDSEVGQSTGYITFDVWLSEQGIAYSLDMTMEAQALKVFTPDFADLSTGGDHCLSMEITVWIPPDAKFESLFIHATSLSIRFADDLDAHVSQESRIEASSGDVYLPSKDISSDETPKPSGMPPGFSSRDVAISTSSGDITGIIYLYDSVDIKTDSGDIDIVVLPQPATRDGGSSVAQLQLGATSGDIACRFPIYKVGKIPDRDYRSSVQTHSGDISGDYVIGIEAVFEAVSGDMEIVALPTTFESSFFTTKTNSGSTHVSVLEPLTRNRNSPSFPVDNIDVGDGDPYLIHSTQLLPVGTDASVAESSTSDKHLRLLSSYHSSSSGDQRIHYPNAWDGEITAVAVSGNILMGGDGVKTIKDSRRDWAYHEVVARKGPDAKFASTLNLHGVSGNLDVWVGKGCSKSDKCTMGYHDSAYLEQELESESQTQ